jgi:DNA-binding transcriptional regulator YbjK
VVKRDGIPGLTHRSVARVAGVPVSSTTYYFETREDLIAAAMWRAIEDYAEDVAQWSDGLTRETLADELARWVVGTTQSPAQRQHLMIGFELDLAALRLEKLRPISHAWDDVLLDVLRKHLPDSLAAGVHAAASGLWMKAVVDDAPLNLKEVVAVFTPIIASADR